MLMVNYFLYLSRACAFHPPRSVFVIYDLIRLPLNIKINARHSAGISIVH